MRLYLFSILAAPKLVLKQIQKIQRKFLWGGSPRHQKWALVEWDTLCMPKELGGLGMRDLVSVNRVMGTKIWWQWITHAGDR